ncbi:hypothetical protein ACFV9C_17925 [Kribbella sp. NPDC059898]|uniref:hypothetical protein n=1 Tax=Kribbella sp. NPDC059898 TaxID=3346995 RepID=UPI003656B297
MSYDLYFWVSGVAEDPQGLANRLADEDADGLEPDERVLAFRGELLRRWPELADRIAPWHEDLEWRKPWGRTDLADRFVGVTLAYGWEATSALPALAGAYGIDTYDPQTGRLARARTREPLDEAAHVEGRVSEDHVVQVLRRISSLIAYAYDELDESALTGALDGTRGDGDWFEYPLAGTPTLTIQLAQRAGGGPVTLRVDGEMDLVLATRIKELLE